MNVNDPQVREAAEALITLSVAAVRGAVTTTEQRVAGASVARLSYGSLEPAGAAPVLAKAIEEWTDDQAKAACACAVTNMVSDFFTDADTFDTLSDTGVVEQLVKLLTNEDEDCRSDAGRALYYLSTNDAAARKLYYFPGFNDTMEIRRREETSSVVLSFIGYVQDNLREFSGSTTKAAQ